MNKFLFGSASSSQQVEGNNYNNQFLKLEEQGVFPEAGNSSDFYNRYEEDILLAKEFGMNAMRIQIEWSRIMPKENVIDLQALEHYTKIFQFMRLQNMEPVVTLFHWTHPAWLSKYGFNSKKFLNNFEKFTEVVVRKFKNEVRFWLVINEPEVFAFEIYHHGQNKNIITKVWQSLRVYWQLLKMHKLAFKMIKKIDPVAQVGIAKNVAYHEPFRKNNLLDNFLVSMANTFGNELFVRLIKNQLDFIGLNYYFYHSLQWSWSNIFKRQNKHIVKSDMGEKTFPKGLYYVLKQFWKLKKPLFVTENGIGNSRDDMRIRFIEEHLQAVLLAKHESVDVRGYFYWSLTDTYEWKSGYDIKFGLVEIDYQTGQRRVRQNFNREKLQQLLNKFD